jgi:hypothetical protein
MPNVRNLFLIGRDSDDEDQLTEMLFWLISALPDVGWELMEMAFGAITVRDPEFEAVTQQAVPDGYIDGLIEANGYRLALESKLASAYGAGQLAKYLRWLAESGNPSTTRSALMTITKNPAPWPLEDRELAAELGVEHVALRWADVHVRLDGLSTAGGEVTVDSRLIGEFLEMLRVEGLVPMTALSDKELATGWGEARATIKHFHEFLKSCRDEVAEALGGEATQSWSEHTDYAYHEFRLPSEVSIVVGLEYSDTNYVRKAGSRTARPVLWVQVWDPSRTNWPETAAALSRKPPQGWSAQLVSRSRLRMWRDASSILRDGTVEDQRASVAAAALLAKSWLESSL